MNAVRYYRILNGYSINGISQLTGISSRTLKAMEQAGRESGVGNISSKHYLRLKNLFGVTVDELLREDLPYQPEPRWQGGEVGGRYEHPKNALVVYRR